MDELLLQSDEWKELITKPRCDCLQFLNTGIGANYWPFTQVKYQLLNVFALYVYIYLLDRLVEIYPMDINALCCL
jgi:hypothetical protein